MRINTRSFRIGDINNFGEYEVFSVSPNGGVIHPVSTSAVTIDSYFDNIQFTPDSQHLVYSTNYGSVSNIYSNKPDGTGVETILNGTSLNGGPQFIKIYDNNRIIYRAFEDSASRYDVYIVNVDGTNRRRLSKDFNLVGFPFYTDSLGKTLVLYELGTKKEIFEVDIESGINTKVLDNNLLPPNFVIQGASYISADNQKIVFTIFDNDLSENKSWVYLYDRSQNKLARIFRLKNDSSITSYSSTGFIRFDDNIGFQLVPFPF